MARHLELSIVVPTFNEAANIEPLYKKLASALAGIRFEVIFVDDDSSDGTADLVRSLAQRADNVRCIQRIGRRGLSSACVEGALSSSAPFIAVMDADLQHDEREIPLMLQILREDAADVVVGSRYVQGGSFGDWDTQRHNASTLATRLALSVTHVPVKDPMSGFFMTRADLWRRLAPNLSSIGFKILLDMLATSKEPLRVAEVPYEFRQRQFGESKLDSMALWHFLMLLVDKRLGGVIPVRFISFAFVGAFGVLVHFLALGLFHGAGFTFLVSQAGATLVAMTSNFQLNNLLTYRDRRLRGARQLFLGWLSFCAVASVGAVSNIGVAAYVFRFDSNWVLSALAGILMGVVWNFVMTSMTTWRA